MQVLYEGTKAVPQSISIMRHLARTKDLYGTVRSFALIYRLPHSLVASHYLALY
jgi:hypothetical protein